jgi:hypothetical protein
MAKKIIKRLFCKRMTILNALKKGFILSLLLTTSIVCAQSFKPLNSNIPAVWNKSELMPEHDKWQHMYDLAESIADDLNSGGGIYSLKIKDGAGGSSSQTYVMQGEKVLGLWSAPNHATYLLGEIFAFNLARVLERSSWSTPAVRMTLTGKGRDQAFDVTVNGVLPKGRRCNQKHQIEYMRQNQHYITGAFMYFVDGLKPKAASNLVDKEHGSKLNSSHFLVEIISGREPVKNIPVYYKKSSKRFYTTHPGGSDVYESTDLKLAKQLSFMMLVDALNSQRDRFGPYGSNMEVMINDNNKEVTLTLVDNGGISASYQLSSYKMFVGQYGSKTKVRVFEEEIYNKIQQLNNLLNGEVSVPMDNYRSETELKQALGFETYQILDKDSSGKTLVDKMIMPSGCRWSHYFLFDFNKRWDNRFLKFKQAIKKIAASMRADHKFF